MSDGHRVEDCPRPTARAKYATRLWVCPTCGQAWQTTMQQPPNLAPTGLCWWWRKWPRLPDHDHEGWAYR